MVVISRVLMSSYSNDDGVKQRVDANPTNMQPIE